VAVAVTTQGVAVERGAAVPVALSALVEERLDRAANVVPSAQGLRAAGLVATEGEAAGLLKAMHDALLAPVTASELPAVRKKLSMLARRPLADRALRAAALCAGDVVDTEHGAPGGDPGAAGTGHGLAEEGDASLAAVVEGWRAQTVTLGRVTVATAGTQAIGDAVERELAREAAWPAAGASPREETWDEEVQVYASVEGSAPDGEPRRAPAGGARVTITARAEHAAQAAQTAELLGDPKGALAARLGGLDAPAKVTRVTATARARGGCIAVELEIAARDLGVDAAGRVATAVALARQEIAAELSEAPSDPMLPYALAHRAADPRDAAELAAWWALSAPEESAASNARMTTAVGLSMGRDPGAALRAATPETDGAAVGARAAEVKQALDRATVAWHEPVVESRAAVEKGQGDLWIALGSPCGTLAEMGGDAGLGAAFALAAAERASDALHESGASAEAWADADGVGVVAHGPPLPGESPEAQARRLADAVARSFAAEPVDREAVSHARAKLLAAGGRDDARALVALANALVPGHPSWIAPMGPVEALGRSSDAAVLGRASALRAGPLRVAVLANESRAQADAAVRAVDRWIARHAGQTRACPVPSTPAPPRAATYAVDSTSGTQAWLALPLPVGDAPPAGETCPGATCTGRASAARTSADWLAAMLGGKDGLLAHALGGGLARSWRAEVVGDSHAPALVIRVDSAPGALDSAVAQVRSLLARVKQGSLDEADRARATALLAERDLAAALDPSHRLLALWNGEAPPTAAPTLDALRAFASATLRDEALIIVAVRPPRPPPDRTIPPTPPKPT
jgi:hypothetical protein